MLYYVKFNDEMNAFANGRKTRRKARWKKKMTRFIGRRYMLVIF